MHKALFILTIISANLTVSAGTIMTVCGLIDSTDLGQSLSHEHLLVDFIGAEETGYHRWDRTEVITAVLPRLNEIKALGFGALFECTPAYLGRDPRLLKTLSEQTGLHLITNTGYYGARQNEFIPEQVQELSIDALASLWIEEFEGGIEDTSIKPGFIKIGVDRDPQLSAMHQKLVRAACRAHLKTGLTIACHTGRTPAIFEIVDILREEGVSTESFIWVHANGDTLENLIKAAAMGLWVSIDHVTADSVRIEEVVTRLIALKEANLLHRVLISHDAGWYRPGELDGGEFRPYTAISQLLVPSLREKGFSQEHLDTLLVVNPREAFSIQLVGESCTLR